MKIAKALIKVAAVLLVMMPTGCKVLTTPQDTAVEKPAKAAFNAAAYYYFSAAQVKLKQGDINEAIWHLRQAVQYDSRSSYLRLELANLLLIKKDGVGALEQIDSVLAHEPDHTRALIAAGKIYHQRKEMEPAKAAFEKALSLKPTDQQIYLLLGRIYWDENDLKNAARVFKDMVERLPHFYASYYFYGKVLLAQGVMGEAEKMLIKSLDMEPTLQEPLEELLKIYKTQGRDDDVSNIYRKLLDLDPDNHAAVIGLAEHYRQVGKDSPARQLLMTLGEKVTRNDRIIPTIYDLYIEPKDYASALWSLGAMLSANPDNSDMNYLAGVAANGLERNQLAIQYLSKVAPKSRFYQNAVVQSALIHHDAGNIDNAIEVVRQAIVHTPDNPEYYLYLGSFFEELERYDDALDSLLMGIVQDDENPRLYFRLGVIYDRLGRKQESIKAMRRVLQLAPDNAEAMNYLGYTYADLGIRLNEAETLIQSALEIKPDDGYITDSLGWVYYKQGQYSEALRWLKKAVSLVPDDPTILEHIGDVYLKMDSRKKALDFYQRSLIKNNKDPNALKEKIRTLAPHSD